MGRGWCRHCCRKWNREREHKNYDYIIILIISERWGRRGDIDWGSDPLPPPPHHYFTIRVLGEYIGKGMGMVSGTS